MQGQAEGPAGDLPGTPAKESGGRRRRAPILGSSWMSHSCKEYDGPLGETADCARLADETAMVLANDQGDDRDT